jgi:hypothetical protein
VPLEIETMGNIKDILAAITELSHDERKQLVNHIQQLNDDVSTRELSLLSEKVLSKDWDKEEEDRAWASYQ